MGEQIVVQMKRIVKVYPDGTKALSGVDFDLRSREIHGLLGENGAGKTTLMKILAGVIRPTSGEIYIRGKKVTLRNPSVALKHGIGMVYQYPALVPVFTAKENIIMGLKRKEANESKLQDIMEKTGLKIRLNDVVESMPMGLRQKTEILKMLYRNVNILILDEPTTNLTPIETEELFATLKKLRDNGTSIVFISHKLKEVIKITDRITVLRKGKVVGTVEASKTSLEELARMMVGREVLYQLERRRIQLEEVALKVENLWVKSDTGIFAVKGLSLHVKKGEILGIAGVEGNGQKELVEAITGLRRAEKGRIFLGNEEITNKAVSTIYKKGLAHIPEDRTGIGLILDMSVAENAILGMHASRPFVKAFKVMDWKHIFSFAKKIVDDLEIVVPSLRAPVKSLSGGNQQKLIVGREFSKKPEVIVAVNPTRGIDVASTEYVRRSLLKMKEAGKAILLVSSDLEEILQLSDRIAVIYEGQIMGELKPEEADEKRLGMLMGGVRLEQIPRGA